MDRFAGFKKSATMVEMSLVEQIPSYSVEDYLQWEGDWELWNGHPIAMAPAPFRPHAKAGTRFLLHVGSQLDENDACNQCELLYEMDWHVDDKTVVRPDIVICCDSDDQKWLTRAPELVAEILSPSTRDWDTTTKKELYAAEGVKFYLIVDPENQKLTTYKLDDGEYEEISEGEPIPVHDECEISISAADIFCHSK